MKYLLIFFSIFALLNCSEVMNIEVNENAEHYVGSENGQFGLFTSTKDDQDFFDENDIETNSKFDLQLTGSDDKIYNATCHLWKNTIKDIIIFCDMVNQLTNDEEFLIQDNYEFEYKGKSVSINFNRIILKLKKVDGKLPFIYSNSQKLRIEESQSTIDVQFNTTSYNGEFLFLSSEEGYGVVELENCRKEGKSLNCQITKKKLDVLAIDENSFKLQYSKEKNNYVELVFVISFKIIYPDVTKQDIYFNITQIMNSDLELNSYIAFETNVTNIDKSKLQSLEEHLDKERKQIATL